MSQDSKSRYGTFDLDVGWIGRWSRPAWGLFFLALIVMALVLAFNDSRISLRFAGFAEGEDGRNGGDAFAKERGLNTSRNFRFCRERRIVPSRQIIIELNPHIFLETVCNFTFRLKDFVQNRGEDL